MRLTTLLLTFNLLQVSAVGFSQSEKFSINVRKGTIKEVLSIIEEKSHYKFLYRDMDIADQTLSVKFNDETLDQILSSLLSKTGTTYRVLDKNLVVIVPENIRQELRVTGTVTDSKTGDPVIGVTVMVQGTNIGTVTDVNGKYNIGVPNANSSLVFSFIGYRTEIIPLNERTVIDVSFTEEVKALDEVVVVGYGVQKKESVTGAISGVTSKDIASVHNGSTVSTTLAGKIAGLSFRQAEGRPGASASLSIRNMGDALYVIDGVQKDVGQFNNISPNDIESISVLKDASASVYGSRAGNGVIIVTTKRGTKGANRLNVDAYTGWQSFTRWPKTTNAYEWWNGRVDAEINNGGNAPISKEELAKWQAGTEYGYKSFNWYDLIIDDNAPLTNININATGGTDQINYYLSLTRLDQNSVFKDYVFNRTNIQSNVDAKIAKNLRAGMQINGRIETRDNPGIPGTDDYWGPRFALFRNTPWERPYANDNPAYLNDIKHNDTNWGLMNTSLSGHLNDTWRVLQTNFSLEYQLPLKGLVAKGLYSYYIADELMDNHEYTYDAYTYYPNTDQYVRTGGSSNPYQERRSAKVLENHMQMQLNYNNTFGKHTIGITFVNERIYRQRLEVYVHDVPKVNTLDLIRFNSMDTYNDSNDEQARVGYVGRFNYDYARKYYLEIAGRRDASWQFTESNRWGLFPSVSLGWRITEEGFMKNLLGENSILSNLKFRGSYGELGDDNVGIGPFDYLSGYNYATSIAILDGNAIDGSRDRGHPIKTISWYASKMTNIGADFAFLNGRIDGSLDYFVRERSGLKGTKWDVLVPAELGYDLPQENLNSDAQRGGELSLNYNGKSGEFNYTFGGNVSYSRKKFVSSYKPRWGNSWDHYRNVSQTQVDDPRWSDIFWGYEVVGQFQSMDQIRDYTVNNDGRGNTSQLPGDLIYKDENGDGVINDMDQRPIGYTTGGTPNLYYGFNIVINWKGIDLRADFSGGAMYSYNRNWEMRWPYQNGGALLSDFYADRWHRADPYDINSQWIPGKFPALRYNVSNNNNYNKNSSFWITNVKYLRMRTLELGYSFPSALLKKVRIQKVRIYVNAYNLLTFDNLKSVGIDPEIVDDNGLQYPQSRYINLGVNLSF